MAVPSLESQREGPIDRYPLLMEHSENQNGSSENQNRHEHVVDITREGRTSLSSSIFHEDENNDDSDDLHSDDMPSRSNQAPITQSSSTAANSRNASFTRRGDNYGRRQRSPLNSGLWISIELVVNMSQIIAAVIVLSLSRREKPQTPLFAWAIGYTAGCAATLPHLYWRYTHRNNQAPDQESAPTQSDSSNNILETTYTAVSVGQVSEGEDRHNAAAAGTSWNGQDSGIPSQRFNSLVDRFKMALDCFFAVWFVVGNVWIFGGHSSISEAPNLYRLCIVFLTFSCIGYAMPFILCATICCCLPCIISVLGIREDVNQNRGATPELINTLPTYKFKSNRTLNKEDSEIGSDGKDEGGILAAGTDKERAISAEDAVCCICLAKYVDNDELRVLTCSHFFHSECVDKWLKINALCPLCKSEVGNS